MTNNYKIRLCLQTFNRPYFAQFALDSLITQGENIEIYISDNSTNFQFQDIYIQNYNTIPNIKYVYRQRNLTAIQHFNILVEESIDFDFVMFFHDDDILTPYYLSEILNSKFLLDENIVAIGINAFQMLGDFKTKKPIIYTKSNITIDSKIKLVNQYFNLEYSGAAPFPGYLYRVKSLLNVKLQKENGGKYSDLIFLIQLLELGKIVWLHKPLMFYRLHKNNDSNLIVNEQRIALKKYLKENNLLPKVIEQDYNMMLLYEKKKNKQIKQFIFYKYALKFIIYNILNFRLFKIIYVRFKKLKLTI